MAMAFHGRTMEPSFQPLQVFLCLFEIGFHLDSNLEFLFLALFFQGQSESPVGDGQRWRIAFRFLLREILAQIFF